MVLDPLLRAGTSTCLVIISSYSHSSPLPRVATAAKPKKKDFGNKASKVAAALRLKGIGMSLRIADNAPSQALGVAGSAREGTHSDNASRDDSTTSPLATKGPSKSLRSAAQDKAFLKQDLKDMNRSQRRPLGGGCQLDKKKARGSTGTKVDFISLMTPQK
jgi:hypothetical protein